MTTKAQRWLEQQMEQPRITVGDPAEMAAKVTLVLETTGQVYVRTGSPYGRLGYASISQEQALQLADWIIENFR